MEIRGRASSSLHPCAIARLCMLLGHTCSLGSHSQPRDGWERQSASCAAQPKIAAVASMQSSAPGGDVGGTPAQAASVIKRLSGGLIERPCNARNCDLLGQPIHHSNRPAASNPFLLVSVPHHVQNSHWMSSLHIVAHASSLAAQHSQAVSCMGVTAQAEMV